MNQSTPDPYVVLGIPRDATAQQVRQAYRRLAKRYHPDLHPGGQTGERMRRINEAWEVLSSPARRARHDADNARQRSSAGHWSRGRHRPPSTATPRPTPERGWGSADAVRSYRRPSGWTDGSRAEQRPSAAPPTRDRPSDHGARWPAVLVAVVIAYLLIGATLLGLFPSPLFAVVILVVASRILGRFP